MTCCSIEPELEGYGFLFFAKNMSKNILLVKI